MLIGNDYSTLNVLSHKKKIFLIDEVEWISPIFLGTRVVNINSSNMAGRLSDSDLGKI